MFTVSERNERSSVVAKSGRAVRENQLRRFSLRLPLLGLLSPRSDVEHQ